jgi:hypothetical protein
LRPECGKTAQLAVKIPLFVAKTTIQARPPSLERLRRVRFLVIIRTLIKVLPSVFLVQVLSSGWEYKKMGRCPFFFGKSFFALEKCGAAV